MLKTIYIIYLVFINILALKLYGDDKSRAVHGRWRISEATLLLVALAGGAAGALLGMLLFHHKTRHAKFVILVPLLLAAHAFLCWWLMTKVF